MTDKKNPCPFCGRSEALVLGPTCNKATPYDPSHRAFPIVRCWCGAAVPGDNWDTSGKTAIAAWNRRAPDDRDARIAELEAKLDAALAPKPAAYPELAPFTVAPWYPDDSGEWVEVPEDLMEMPAELQRFQTIQTLRRAERVRRGHDAIDESAGGAGWAIPPEHFWRIVAYKVVKP